MKTFFEEYGMLVIYFIIALVLVVAVAGFTYKNTGLQNQMPETRNVSAGSNIELAEQGLPTLEVKSSVIKRGQPFQPLDYVTKVCDSAGNDLKDRIEVYGLDELDVNKNGSYVITYVVTDSNGLTTRVEASFIVD